MHRVRDLYQSYRKQIDVRQVLERYGAENCHETTNADGTTEIIHSCLLDRVEPHHANGDAHPSAWANVEKGLYCCAVYWAGDILRLIQKLEGKDDFSEVNFGAFFGPRDHESVRKQIESYFTEPVFVVDTPSYSDRVLEPWLRSHPYMREDRGISQQAHQLLGIGYDMQANRIVFPHWWDGKLVGWQKRTIPPSEHWPGTFPPYPKYKNSTGFPKSETLYAYDMARSAGARNVVVVESPMSVAKAFSLGLSHGESYDVVATFGAKVSTTQIDLLRDFPRVYIWFDDDVAGHNGERKLVEGLYRHTEVLVVNPDPDKDMGDADDVFEVIDKLELATPAALWLAKRRRQWKTLLRSTKTAPST